MIVYSDSQILDLEWIPLLNLPADTQVVHSLEEFEKIPSNKKVALTAHRLHVMHDADISFDQKVKRLSAAANLVFLFESELHQDHWNIWKRTFSPNHYWIVPGFINDNISGMDPHLIFWGDWFKTSALLYSNLPDKLSQLNPYNSKPKMFDALLGAFKPHRSFIANAVEQFNLADKVILTYGGKWDDNKFYAKDYFIWEPDCVPVDNIVGTADWVEYCGQRAHLSQVIPINVYNDTAYSIVAETDHDNTLSFFSEKTAKVFIARRLFVAFSGYKFLHNLRRIGFKTFDGIIDESYDEVFNDNQRYSMAFEQVRKLCEMDQLEVLEQVRPILEHNHQMIMETNWTYYAATQIKGLIRSLNAD